MYLLIVAAVVVFDQAIKIIVKSNMQVFESIPIIDGVFNFTYFQNTGAAFSIFQGKNDVLLLLNIALIILMVAFLIYGRNKEGAMVLVGVSLIIGGGLGNIVDRIIQGFVVDYIQIGSFPIFNLADMCVCIGCGLVIIYLVFFERKKSKENE